METPNPGSQCKIRGTILGMDPVYLRPGDIRGGLVNDKGASLSMVVPNKNQVSQNLSKVFISTFPISDPVVDPLLPLSRGRI